MIKQVKKQKRNLSLGPEYLNLWGPVHMETLLAVYVNILYLISVSSRGVWCFGSLKLLFFETGTQSG